MKTLSHTISRHHDYSKQSVPLAVDNSEMTVIGLLLK